MKTFIPQRLVNLIIILSVLGVFTGCNASTSEHLKSYPLKTLTLNDKIELKVYVADTNDRQRKGLSEILSSDFAKNELMLFPSKKMKARQFWMPQTHFDLDIIFLNQDHYIVDIHTGLKHHSAKGAETEVPRSKTVFSKDVLEIRTDSPFAKKFRVGMKLILK